MPSFLVNFPRKPASCRPTAPAGVRGPSLREVVRSQEQLASLGEASRQGRGSEAGAGNPTWPPRLPAPGRVMELLAPPRLIHRRCLSRAAGGGREWPTCLGTGRRTLPLPVSLQERQQGARGGDLLPQTNTADNHTGWKYEELKGRNRPLSFPTNQRPNLTVPQRCPCAPVRSPCTSDR